VVSEELAYGDLAIAIYLMTPRLIALPLLEMGTHEQRKKYLPKFATDDFCPASAAAVEPRFDFDTSAMATTARRNGSNYVISGAKCFVPLAAESDNILVFAALQSSVEAFIVARDAKGVEISGREKNMGLKGLATYEIALNDCSVAADARLGGEQGINFKRLISQSRVALSAMGVGLMRSAFEYARDYAKDRKAFGAPIATKQAIAFILADMAIEIDASRLLVLDAAARLDKGEDSLKESYLARNYVANSALRVTDNAVQVLGGHGYIREHPVEMWLRNARGLSSIEAIALV
jgi:acyl-CoA dehydrogenase